MATKAQVHKTLAAQGGHWDEEFHTLDAPARMNWTSTGCHSIAIPHTDPRPASKRWDEAMDSIEHGVEPCTLTNCDICAEQAA